MGYIGPEFTSYVARNVQLLLLATKMLCAMRWRTIKSLYSNSQSSANLHAKIIV